MNSNPEASAAAASDSYTNRSQGQVDKFTLDLDNQKYRVFGYKNDLVTGFHATAYQNLATGDIIIAYRGTDPGLFTGNDKLGHALTTLQDIAVDATMVRDNVNPQIRVADEFTAEMLEKAQDNGIHKDQVTVAGHSLGGTIAQAEAAKFGLSGATYNAFGAVGIVPGVPEGGTKVTNYVMAGDVVSAANHHYGQVVPLASDQDLTFLQNGRYLNAPPGAAEPNPLLAMVGSDHSIGHFTDPNNILTPDLFRHAEQNYAANKTAIDAYRSDIYRERAELSEALRQAQGHPAQAQLPPNIQRQLNEYLAVNVDPSVQKMIEQNTQVTGVEHGLQQGADAMRVGGQFVQSQDERVATVARTVGESMLPLNPVAPLVGAAAGEVAHLHGEAVQAVGNYAADQLHAAKQTVEQAAHDVTQAVQATIHSPDVQAGVIPAVNHIVDAYRKAEATGHAIEQSYENVRKTVSDDIQATKQAVSHDIDAVKQTAGNAVDALSHPGQWFGHASAPLPSSSDARQPQSPVVTPSEPGFSRDDPRNPGNPHHGLYQELKERIPAAGENRLLQFTGACLANGISEKNLGQIAFDRQGGHMVFHPSSTGPIATVDVKEPSPPPAQTIQHIQQNEQMQAAIQTAIQAQNMQINQQQSQGPTPGGLGY